MKKIESLNIFQEQLLIFKKENSKFSTNFYLQSNTLEELIKIGKVFSHNTQHGLYILIDGYDFYNLFFYQSQMGDMQFNINNIKNDKPIVMDIVYNDIQKENLEEFAIHFWGSIGFKRYKEYIRMIKFVVSCSDLKALQKEREDEIFHVGVADVKKIDEITSLWRSSLDIFSSAIPQGEQLEKIINRGEVIIIVRESGGVIGALQSEIIGNVCYIHRVAVEKDCRRMGVGQAMLKYCFDNFINIKKYSLWVDQKNLGAIKLYLKNDFNFDNRYNLQLIKNN